MIITRKFIQDHIGDFAFIATLETKTFDGYYEGVLKEFKNDSLLLDNKVKIDYEVLASISFSEIN